VFQTGVLLKRNVDHVHVLEHPYLVESGVVAVDESKVLLGLSQLVLTPIHYLRQDSLGLHDLEQLLLFLSVHFELAENHSNLAVGGVPEVLQSEIEQQCSVAAFELGIDHDGLVVLAAVGFDDHACVARTL